MWGRPRVAGRASSAGLAILFVLPFAVVLALVALAAARHRARVEPG
jgi:Tfp pilus assembly protein PilX